MKKLRIWNDKRRGKERWWLSYGKTILSGPWKTSKEAVNDKKEWIVW